jgi:TrmH family RNA methyltransferase
MGAVFRVTVHEIEQSVLIALAEKESVDLFATTMNGQSIHGLEAQSSGVLLMGNEGMGLSENMLKAASKEISIPGNGRAESLNVAVATGILTDWIHRNS